MKKAVPETKEGRSKDPITICLIHKRPGKNFSNNTHIDLKVSDVIEWDKAPCTKVMIVCLNLTTVTLLCTRETFYGKFPSLVTRLAVQKRGAASTNDFEEC